MAVIDQDRDALDEALDNCDLRIFLVSGSDNTAAEAIYDKAKGIDNRSFRTFWIKNLELLTSAEKSAWFAAGGRYAVVCECDDNEERHVGTRGPHADLLLPSGNPSVTFIRDAFATCTHE